MMTGLAIGASAGLVIGSAIVANIIGFPEVEAGELVVFTLFGEAGADVVAAGGFIGGAWGGGTGMMIGLVATPPSRGGGGGP